MLKLSRSSILRSAIAALCVPGAVLAQQQQQAQTGPQPEQQTLEQITVTGTRIVVLVTRIKEITPGETPVLASTHSQEQIAKYARDSLDEYRLERAFVKLHAAAYVWPPEYAAPQKH